MRIYHVKLYATDRPVAGALTNCRLRSRAYPGRNSQMDARKIIHVDMDAFYASVEQRDDPKLRGVPVVVAWRGKRSVVCAASYEARKFGVRSAMPAIQAERLCPHAVFLPPDFPRYRAVSRNVREIFLRHTDLVEPLSLDEAYLDVTENKTGLPSATQVARTIREQIRHELNLTASAGVAPNKFLAKIASDWRKPDGLFVIKPDKAIDFLTPLAVERLPGVGKVTAQRLIQLGVKTVGDIRRLDAAVLQERFGRYGIRLYELARGIDNNPVEPNRPTQSISAEDTFESDVLLNETEAMIRRLAEKVWQASRKESRDCENDRAQAQNSGVQYSHAKPYARLACFLVRRTHQHRSRASRKSTNGTEAEIPPRRRRSVEFPRSHGQSRRTICSFNKRVSCEGFRESIFRPLRSPIRTVLNLMRKCVE